MNWETKETLLIISNTESLYLDIIVNRLCAEDIITECDLFNHISFENINIKELNDNINEMRSEL